MSETQNAVLLECHDGYLHPQLEDLPCPSAQELEALLVAAGLSEKHTVDTAAADGILPFPAPETRGEPPAAVRHAIVQRRAELELAVPRLVNLLKEKRQQLEDAVFRLELRLEQLDVTERQLALRVRELDAGPQRPPAAAPPRAADDVALVEVVVGEPHSPPEREP